MKEITSARSRLGAGAAGLALAWAGAVSMACVSGGGPPLAGAAAEALFADLTGVWVLDESGSSPPLPVPPELRSFEFFRGSPRENRESEALVSYLSVIDAAFEVLRHRPDTLRLRVDEVEVVYAPSPGGSITVPMDGGSVLYRLQGLNVRTRIAWEDYTWFSTIAPTVGRVSAARCCRSLVDASG